MLKFLKKKKTLCGYNFDVKIEYSTFYSSVYVILYLIVLLICNIRVKEHDIIYLQIFFMCLLLFTTLIVDFFSRKGKLLNDCIKYPYIHSYYKELKKIKKEDVKEFSKKYWLSLELEYINKIGCNNKKNKVFLIQK